MDPESNAEQVMEFVGGLMVRLEGLHKKAFTYKSYQKNFKVCQRPLTEVLCTYILHS